MRIDTHEHTGHHHDHTHDLTKSSLRIAFFLTAIILIVEVTGGLLANSLALVSDAAHVITDLFALGLAWFAAWQAERPSNERKTFGYHRVGILAALLNAVTLIVVAVAICWEAVQRLQHPEPVQPLIMFGAALVGIAANLFIGFGLRRAGDNLNVRAAMLHVFGDVAVSLGVIVAGVIILLTHWTIVDPLLSIGVALLVAFGAWNILHETTNILMEAAPKGISLGNLVQDMKNVKGVKDVHDLHVWSIASGMNALSCHILIDNLPMSASSSIRQSLARVLDKKYHINHSTIQFECDANKEACCGQSNLYCQLTPAKRDAHSAHHHNHEHEHE
jgi:cobalt-zinc-cadmium efflux system protein